MTSSDFSSAVSALERHSDKLSHAVGHLEIALFSATVLVVIGLFIEAIEVAEYVHRQQRRLKRGLRIEWVKGAILFGAFLVIIGVIGEGAIQFFASKDESQRYVDERNIDRLRTDEAVQAEGKIAAAETAAATANTKAAVLSAENVELERELAPRDIDPVKLAFAMTKEPRVPLAIVPMNSEEPIDVANRLYFALATIKIAGAAAWSVMRVLPIDAVNEGITVEYARIVHGDGNKNSKGVATVLCEAIKSQGYKVMINDIPMDMPATRAAFWLATAPEDAVVIRVGRKSNHFWRNKEQARKGMTLSLDGSFCTPDEALEEMQAEQDADDLQAFEKRTPPE